MRDDYGRFGVPEYWVIDPAALSARIWCREGDGLREAGVVTGSAECTSLPGFTLDLLRLTTR